VEREILHFQLQRRKDFSPLARNDNLRHGLQGETFYETCQAFFWKFFQAA
jgi:hypothetical protein